MRKLHLFSILVALSIATTNLPATPSVAVDGKLPGGFSVSETKKIFFSQGNLQYTGAWRFADEQWSTFGTSQSDNHRDYFAWGTGNKPNTVSQGGSYSSFYEYGNNVITNGGTQSGIWRTLTSTEWTYLINSRSNYSSRRTLATVNGIHGYILLPDNWSKPSDVTLSIKLSGSYTTNNYNLSQWEKLEAAGAVFLPAVGYFADSQVQDTNSGLYWTSTRNNDYSGQGAYRVDFSVNNFNPSSSTPRWSCSCVRLVQYAPAPEITIQIPSTLYYTGSNQPLVTSGSAVGGTMQYKLNSGSWTTTIPTASAKGTYSVYYKAVGDATHSDSEVYGPIQVQIINPLATLGTHPTAISPLKYNGSNQALVNQGSGVANGTLQYSLNGTSWSTSIPTGLLPGDYNVYYRVLANSGYSNFIPNPAYIVVNIAKGDIDVSGLSVIGNSLFANGSPQELVSVSGSVSGGTLKYSTDGISWSTDIPTESEVGTYTVYYMVEGDANHNDYTPVPAYITVSIEDYPYVADNEDPSSILEEFYAAGTAKDLKVKRTIYADDEYNTICLPFSLDASALATSPLAGFNRLKTFKGAQVTGTAPDLYIDIFVEDATTIEAGVPYLITYPSANADIVNPVFNGITVTTTEPSAVSVDGITFQGMFAQVHIDPYDVGHTQDYLFLGANSQLYWPSSDQTSSSIKMRGFRAYFIIDRNSISPALAPKGTRARIMDAPKTTTAIDNTSAKFGGSEKIIENGILYIIRNGLKYNGQGQIVK